MPNDLWTGWMIFGSLKKYFSADNRITKFMGNVVRKKFKMFEVFRFFLWLQELFELR